MVQPVNFKSDEDINRLKDFKPDIIVICAYGQVLPPAVLDIPRRQCINIHYSLLPRHRGASPVAAAILAGDEFTGVSIQLVRRKLDSGPLLISGAVTISPNDNTGSLMEKLSPVGAGLLLEGMSGWLRGTIPPREQDEAGATYFAQIDKSAGDIDWSLPAEDISRRIRAFSPWPGCFTRWKGEKLNIIEGSVAVSGENIVEPGRVAALAGTKGGVGIGTGKGLLVVRRVKLAGKREMAAAEFIRGQRDFIGSKLPS